MGRRFGHYHLEERLAVGGMGELFLASPPAGRPVSVVKVLHPDFLENPEYVAMFEDEGRIASRLAHPNIVGVHETGRVDEVPFIAFELVDGENLRTVLDRCAVVGVRVPPEIAVRIAVGVLLGLDHAHRAKDERGRPLNLVHRDLSPDNIVLSWEGEAKILDFGIAKAEGRATRTQVGVLKGKSQYMAPEQARAAEVDPRTDLFGLGLVLLELLTGRKRFEFDDAVRQLIAAQEWRAYAPSEHARDLPVELDAIVLKALEPAPERRFQSAEAFAAALTRLIQQGALPRSEPVASFLRRLFPGRKSRAALSAANEPTLLPRVAADSTAARTPLPRELAPTVPRTPAPTVPRSSPAFELHPDEPPADPDTVAREVSARDPDDDTRTAGRALAPGSDDDATRPSAPALARSEWEDRTTARAPFVPASERPRPAAPRVPPPVIRPPGSTPRPARAPTADALEVPPDEGVYDGFHLPRPPGRSEVRRAAVLVKRPRGSRRALRVLLLLALLVAGAGAIAEHRARLEAYPPVADAIAKAKRRLGLAEPTPEPPPVVVVVAGSGGGAAMAVGTPEPGEVTPDPSPATTGGATPAPARGPTPRPELSEARPLSASVRVTSDPPGFEILVDKKPTGKRTPATVLVPAGRHEISLDAPGYRPWSFEETFAASDRLQIPAVMIRE